MYAKEVNQNNKKLNENNKEIFKDLEVPIWMEELNKINHPKSPDTMIGLLNTRGWDDEKYLEIENNFISNNDITTIMILTEVQTRQLKTGTRNTTIYTKLRKKGNKKGGGIMILHRNNEEIELEERKTLHKDLLILEGKIKGKK